MSDSVSPRLETLGALNKGDRSAEPPLSGRSPNLGPGAPQASQGLSGSIVEEGDEEIEAPVPAAGMLRGENA